MGRISRVASVLISLAVSVLTILFLYNYLAPVGLPNSILGPQYSSLMGSSGYAAFLPGGVAGLLLFAVLSRIGSVTSAATVPSAPSPDEIMRRMNFPAAMMGGVQPASQGNLPSDISRSQFIVLRLYRQGYKSTKDISKSLSMDKNEVEKEVRVLRANGYLTKDNKLTSKAMDLLGN